MERALNESLGARVFIRLHYWPLCDMKQDYRPKFVHKTEEKFSTL